MKKLPFFLLLLAIVSCEKNNLKPSNPLASEQTTTKDPRIGTELSWKCIGGDTTFTDTLVMRLTSITINTHNQEEFYFLFKKPIWNYTDFLCTDEDLKNMPTLSFTGSNCKTATFKRL